MPARGAGARARKRQRQAAKFDHHWRGTDGVSWHERASFTQAEADRAQLHIYVLTSRRYSAYECRWQGCGAWHIRPCRRRPEDMARPA